MGRWSSDASAAPPEDPSASVWAAMSRYGIPPGGPEVWRHSGFVVAELNAKQAKMRRAAEGASVYVSPRHYVRPRLPSWGPGHGEGRPVSQPSSNQQQYWNQRKTLAPGTLRTPSSSSSSSTAGGTSKEERFGGSPTTSGGDNSAAKGKGSGGLLALPLAAEGSETRRSNRSESPPADVAALLGGASVAEIISEDEMGLDFQRPWSLTEESEMAGAGDVAADAASRSPPPRANPPERPKYAFAKPSRFPFANPGPGVLPVRQRPGRRTRQDVQVSRRQKADEQVQRQLGEFMSDLSRHADPPSVEAFFARKECHKHRRSQGAPVWCPGNSKHRPGVVPEYVLPRSLCPSVASSDRPGGVFAVASTFTNNVVSSFRPPSCPVQGPWCPGSKNPWSTDRGSRGGDSRRLVLLEGQDWPEAEYEERLLREKALRGQQALLEERKKKLASFQEGEKKRVASRPLPGADFDDDVFDPFGMFQTTTPRSHGAGGTTSRGRGSPSMSPKGATTPYPRAPGLAGHNLTPAGEPDGDSSKFAARAARRSTVTASTNTTLTSAKVKLAQKTATAAANAMRNPDGTLLFNEDGSPMDPTSQVGASSLRSARAARGGAAGGAKAGFGPSKTRGGGKRYTSKEAAKEHFAKDLQADFKSLFATARGKIEEFYSEEEHLHQDHTVGQGSTTTRATHGFYEKAAAAEVSKKSEGRPPPGLQPAGSSKPELKGSSSGTASKALGNSNTQHHGESSAKSGGGTEGGATTNVLARAPAAKVDGSAAGSTTSTKSARDAKTRGGGSAESAGNKKGNPPQAVLPRRGK